MLNHVAIIPDGNRRWAKQHGLPALEGHRRGAEAMHNAIDYLIDRVKYLTLWGFSTDNWKRNRDEVNDIFQLLAAWIERDTPWLNSQGVKLHYIGRIHQLPQYLKAAIQEAISLTQNNTSMMLILAFNYSGRTEIAEAVRLIIDLHTPSTAVGEELLGHYLYTGINDIPDVDLVIRTAGEFRLSNFMLWQTAYSEFYFTPVLWPDFDNKELDRALLTYSERKRRFGGD